MTDTTDDQILELAQEIKSKEGGSLTDAMLKAEERLAPKPSIPEDFTVTIPVKPRVARWIVEEFGGHAHHSLETRLGAYLTTVLNRARIDTIRIAEEAPDIQEGQAVTMTRAKFVEKAPAS